MTQVQPADRAGVSRRWLSDLEAGKPTAEVGLVFKVVCGGVGQGVNIGWDA
jgi:HTH-type transcriptional regulator / antitoxin HipB